MTRTEAVKFTHQRLVDVGLPTWGVRVDTAINGTLGKCSYDKRTIFLSAHHIDTHPTEDVIETINHEIAHALTPGHNHDNIWAKKALECGCKSTDKCGPALSMQAIDAARSNQPTINRIEAPLTGPGRNSPVKRFTTNCKVCNVVAKEKSSVDFRSKDKLFKKITYECGHISIVPHDSQSAFDLIVSNDWKPEIANCKHEWNPEKKTECVKCHEYRLYKFQVEGARFLEAANGKAAVFDEMGLGKTVQSLAYLKFHPEAFPVLFIVKSGIKYQWMKEIVRWLGEKYFPQIISAGKSGVMPGLKCYVTSYDLLRHFDTAKLAQLNIQTVVMDECQQIKNPDATRTREVRKVCRDIPGIIPLSGTPWKNRGSEFFVALNMLSPEKFHSYQSFVNTWVESYYDGAKYKEGGIKNPAKFRDFIKDIAIRRERAEVMPELPLINRMKLHCIIEDHAKKAYDESVSEFVKLWNNAVIGGEEETFGAQSAMIAQLQRMRHILGLAKIPSTMEFVEEFIEETDRKLIIGGHHKDVCEILYRKCVDLGKDESIPVLKITGDMNGAERFDIQEKFNSLKRCLMVVSTLASGEGLNLQTCSDMIVHERQWNPMNEEQLEGRMVRIGQLAQSINATYIHADGDGSVDIHLDRIVEGKRIQFHNVMNKGTLPQWNEQSLIKELMASIVNSVTRKK